jgi:phospholipase C
MRESMCVCLLCVLLAPGCSSSSDDAATTGPTTDATTDGAADVSDTPTDAEAAPRDLGPIDAFEPPVDPHETERTSCAFRAGAMPNDTIGNLPAKLPIQHLLILVQENRTFDHLLGRHPRVATGEMDGFPPEYVNVAVGGATYPPVHATTGCISPDVPHSWAAMHASWNGGKNDGFYVQATRDGPGARAIAYYEPADLPFYTWLYGEWASSDRFFASLLGPTAPNRGFLYAGTSSGQKDGAFVGAPSIFGALTAAKVDWIVYMGATYSGSLPVPSAEHQRTVEQLTADLAAGTLPAVAFINGPFSASEHPPLDVREGERFVAGVVKQLFASPAWSTSALIVTYDEGGGFFDHEPPPSACPPDGRPENVEFDRYGFRLPFVVVSPFARPRYVSHRVHSHTSILRLVETMFSLPALTNRDANSDALLDTFDFEAAPRAAPEAAAVPEAGRETCAGT